jgi:hypothetical protein
LISSEFKRLFDNFDYEVIREEILNRQMMECHFTTVLWRIFLHCLPRDSNQWNDMLDATRRNYEKLVQQHQIDPYQMSDDNSDIQNVNHPLSRDENVIRYRNIYRDFTFFILEFMGTIFR